MVNTKSLKLAFGNVDEEKFLDVISNNYKIIFKGKRLNFDIYKTINELTEFKKKREDTLKAKKDIIEFG